MKDKTCPECKGFGSYTSGSGEIEVCADCGGVGTLPVYREYQVTWTIEVSATSAKNAARYARTVQLDQTQASMDVYDISKRGEDPQTFEINNEDLEEQDDA